MEHVVKVKIEYLGRFAEAAGKKMELLEVPQVIAAAYELIQKYLSERYNIIPPYIIMFNNVHILGALKRNKDKPLTESDTFRVLPFISGG